MARRKRNDGSWIIDGLKDLKRGDKVYVTLWGFKYIPTIVTRVRTVECATIVTVEKRDEVRYVRFVGYHTDNKANGDHGGVLTIYDHWAETAERKLEEAASGSKTIAKRADALIALRTLKDWLNHKEDSVYQEVE